MKENDRDTGVACRLFRLRAKRRQAGRVRQLIRADDRGNIRGCARAITFRPLTEKNGDAGAAMRCRPVLPGGRADISCAQRPVWSRTGQPSALRPAWASPRQLATGTRFFPANSSSYPRRTVANIYLLINLSIDNTWLAATMRANWQLLAAHGIDLAPFDNKKVDSRPFHDAFWLAPPDAPSPALAAKLGKVQASLAAGRSVLFLGQGADVNMQANFFAFLRKHLPTKIHTVKPLLLVGKLPLLMESWWRGSARLMDASLAAQYLNYASNGAQLITQALEEWGRERASLIPILVDRVSASGVAEAARRVFTALGIEKAPQPVAPLAFYGFTNIVTALRLLEARQVRHNDWPRLDSAAYMTALQAVERD